MTRSAKHYCFTINNYTNADKQRLASLFGPDVSEGGPVYLVYGEEVGDSGTPHLQGYVCFSDRRTLRSAKEAIGSRAHLEVARGSPQQASDYCKKDGDYTEFGQLPAGRGERSDLALLAERIRSGCSQDDIAKEFPGHYIRHRRNILAFIAELKPKRNWVCDVIVLWGVTGTGKTRYVFDNHESVYVHPGEQWFDGYDGQEVVLFDDYNGSEFKLTYLLKLLDRYEMRVPVKGGYIQWAPKTIYFTSNREPSEWYHNALDRHRDALMRRITEVRFFPAEQ